MRRAIKIALYTLAGLAAGAVVCVVAALILIQTAWFHEKVRQGFLTMAQERPDRFTVVDASRPPDDVARAIAEAVTRVLR